jgi:hypothetical protein
MNSRTQKGFVLLADITGFTHFVMQTELAHSNEIINQILTDLVSFLTPTFTLAEIEGDAVFLYAPFENIKRGETILEIVESSYAEFRDKKASYLRSRTCNCLACQMVINLDLKYVIHFGEFVLNDMAGRKKPLGNSINTAHRLLKNGLYEETGWKAYALYTEDCLKVVNMDKEIFYHHVEHLNHIGAVVTYSLDLDTSYKKSLAERRVYLTHDEADVVIERNFPVSPPVLWEWANDPKKRMHWNPGSDWIAGLRPSGRVAKGATNHCVNSKVIEMLQDYRPYHYYTSRIGKGPLQIILTCEFVKTPNGTQLSWRAKLDSILPRPIRSYLCGLIAKKVLNVNKTFDLLNQQIQKEPKVEDVPAIV